MTLGEQIKQAREKKNLSQEDLASKLEVSRQAISKWENDTSSPKGINREMLNQVLELSIETGEDKGADLTGKYKLLMIVGWGLAIIFAVSTIILSVLLYKAKSSVTYLPTENISTDYYDDQENSGTDSNSESTYIYYENDMATEEDIASKNYAPKTNDNQP